MLPAKKVLPPSPHYHPLPFMQIIIPFLAQLWFPLSSLLTIRLLPPCPHAHIPHPGGLVQIFRIDSLRASPSQSHNTTPSSPSSHRSRPPLLPKARVSCGRTTTGQPRQRHPKTNKPKQRGKRQTEKKWEQMKRRRKGRRTLRLRVRRRRNSPDLSEWIIVWSGIWLLSLECVVLGEDLGVMCVRMLLSGWCADDTLLVVAYYGSFISFLQTPLSA